VDLETGFPALLSFVMVVSQGRPFASLCLANTDTPAAAQHLVTKS